MHRPTLALLVLSAIGCGAATTPSVEPRVAQLQRVPPGATAMAQTDAPRVLPQEDVDRWLDWLHRSNDAIPDTACVGPMVASARFGTAFVVPDAHGDPFDGVVMGIGDVTAAEVAACLGPIVEPLASNPGAEPRDGRYVIGRGEGTLHVVDLPDGTVALGTPGGIAAMISDAEAPNVSSSETLARVRGLLAPGDLEVFLLTEIPGMPPFRGAGFSVARGAKDRYEVVVVTASSGEAQLYALGLYAGLPMALGSLEEAIHRRISDGPPGDIEAAVAGEILPRVEALHAELDVDAISVDGNVLRLAFELDPAAVTPLDVAAIAGMAYLAMTGCDCIDPGGLRAF